MAKDHLGKPSGANKREGRTGTPSDITPEKMDQDQNISEKYTTDENEIADNVRTGHPNRNTDKEDSTNIGGYRA